MHTKPSHGTGAIVGDDEGESDGDIVGDSVGITVGGAVGDTVGPFVGKDVGAAVTSHNIPEKPTLHLQMPLLHTSVPFK